MLRMRRLAQQTEIESMHRSALYDLWDVEFLKPMSRDLARFGIYRTLFTVHHRYISYHLAVSDHYLSIYT